MINIDVRSTHKEYDKYLKIWAMCRAASAGEHAVHEAREAYLPRLKGEDEQSYALRTKMTPFFNATWRTISGLRGMLFRKEPTYECEENVSEMMDDIDLAGTSIEMMAKELAQECLTVGRAGLMTDYPTVPEGSTMMAAETAGYRASIQLYKCENIYNWKTSRLGSITVLSEVRLEEKYYIETDNEWETKYAKQYRVLDLVDGKYRQRIYRSDQFDNPPEQYEGDIYPTLSNGENLDYIPFVFVGVDTVGPEVALPPLLDLITTNFHHYMQATSYERGCFFSGLPTMFIYGHDAEAEGSAEIKIGGKAANSMPNPATRAEWLEVQSEFRALRTNLEDKKSEMAILGARMLESQKSGVESAEALARRQNGEESLLADMSGTLSEGIERALQWLSDWQGNTSDVEYHINQDFLPAAMDSTQLTALVSAWQMGAISQETLFDNMKAGEIVSGDTTFEQEQERINGRLTGMAE